MAHGVKTMFPEIVERLGIQTRSEGSSTTYLFTGTGLVMWLTVIALMIVSGIHVIKKALD